METALIILVTAAVIAVSGFGGFVIGIMFSDKDKAKETENTPIKNQNVGLEKLLRSRMN